MAEGLGLAASVIAVLQITNSVLSVCYEYRAIVHNASGELSKVVAEMKSLRDVLESLEPLAAQAESANPTAGTRMPTLALLCEPQGLLDCCKDEVARLETRLKPPSWADSFGQKRKAVTQALRWPLNKASTEETLEDIGRFKSTLNLAITADEATLTLAIQKLSLSTNHIVLETQEDVRAMKDTVSGLSRDVQTTQDVTLSTHQGMERIDQERIYSWLAAPDPSTNYNHASRSRRAKTGSWFLESETFTHWKEPNSLVWLHGKPGCGKTVLSSTIVSEVLQETRSKSKVAVAYFYFDFNDVEKQKSDKMIRSLITQLSKRSTKKPDRLESLFSSCNNGGREPDVEGLMIVMEELVESFDETYIVLDALDECSDRGDLLECIEEVWNWKLRQLHMLATSRSLKDIEESLKSLIDPRNRICIQSSLVDADILTYVHERLQSNQEFKRWRKMPHVQEEIETTLMEKADGMFRWAVCQLDVLQHCPRLPALRAALESLPTTLDETYSRILRNIPEECSQDAIKILQWLTHSLRPLQVKELAEIVAVNIKGNPWFRCEERFPDDQEVLTICSSLVAIEEAYMSIGRRKRETVQTVRLAHFSVKEYLVSERVRNQAAAKYAIQEIQANESIAAACLAYLLHINQHDSFTSKTIEEFPLAVYAAKYWIDHTRVAGENLDAIKMLLLEFCQVRCEAFGNCYRFYDPERSWLAFDVDRKIEEIVTPLYYASLAGVNELVRLLLEKGADVNAEGGPYGNALQAASARGHHTVVQLLLEKGADVNAKGGLYASALHAASARAHETVMQLLLEKGADVNVKGGYFGNALQAASFEGYLTVTQLLLEKEADVNAKGGKFHHALQAASVQGHLAVVQLLLEKGADVNAKGVHFGSALQAASFRDHHTVMQLLLENGADVNAEGGHYGSALQAASVEGHLTVVQLLLEKGADVNVKGGYFGSALQAASYKDHHTVMQLLLENGADVNAEGGHYGSALQAASVEGHLTVVQLLLEKGADVNAKGGRFDNAMHAASVSSHPTVVQLLLENGADVRTEGEKYDSALKLVAKAVRRRIISKRNAR